MACFPILSAVAFIELEDWKKVYVSELVSPCRTAPDMWAYLMEKSRQCQKQRHIWGRKWWEHEKPRPMWRANSGVSETTVHVDLQENKRELFYQSWPTYAENYRTFQSVHKYMWAKGKQAATSSCLSEKVRTESNLDGKRLVTWSHDYEHLIALLFIGHTRYPDRDMQWYAKRTCKIFQTTDDVTIYHLIQRVLQGA